MVPKDRKALMKWKIILPNGLTMRQFAPSKRTKCERTVIRWLRSFGLRVHENCKLLPGTPDAVVKELRLCVFADGDFWHRPSRMIRAHKPHHRENWTKRAWRGKRRELRQNRELFALGWRVVRVWESSINKRPRQTKEKLLMLLHADFDRVIRI